MHINITVNVHLVIKKFNRHDAMSSSYATVRSETVFAFFSACIRLCAKVFDGCSPEKPVPEVTNRLVDEVMVVLIEASVIGNVTQHTVSAV